MRWAACALLLSACEREGEGRFTPPHVGQQQDVTTIGELTVGIGETARHGAYRTVLHTKVLEVSGLAITKMRVLVIHDMYAFEDDTRPPRTGIYELSTVGGFTITKAAGQLTDYERKYFEDWKPTLDRRGTRNVLERTLRVGQRFVPTDEERDSLGFPRSSNFVVVPREVERDSVTFDITYEAEMGDPHIIAHAHGWIRYGAHGTEADQTAEVTVDGQPAGSLHWYDTRAND